MFVEFRKGKSDGEFLLGRHVNFEEEDPKAGRNKSKEAKLDIEAEDSVHKLESQTKLQELQSEFDIYMFWSSIMQSNATQISLDQGILFRFRMYASAGFFVYLFMVTGLYYFLIRKVIYMEIPELSGEMMALQYVMTVYLYLVILNEVNYSTRMFFVESKLSKFTGTLHLIVCVVTYFASVEFMLRTSDFLDLVQDFGTFCIILEIDNVIVVPIEMHFLRPGVVNLELWNLAKNKMSRVSFPKSRRRYFIASTVAVYGLFALYSVWRISVVYHKLQ